MSDATEAALKKKKNSSVCEHFELRLESFNPKHRHLFDKSETAESDSGSKKKRVFQEI